MEPGVGDNLIERAVAGDPAALQGLLQAHHRRLVEYIGKHLPAELRGEAGDVAQDVCFEACRLIAGFRPQGEDAFFRWLATIARHDMIDLARRRQARPEATLAKAAEDEASVVAALEQLAVYRRTPSRSAAAHELARALDEAIERLPADYQEVLKLRHLGGLSVEETARQMNKPAETVYVLTSRALKAVREHLRSASKFV